MRVGLLQIFHESNTFMPTPTTLDSFKQAGFYRGQALIDHYEKANSHVSGFITGLREAGITPVPLLAAHATPSGTVTADALDTLLSIALEELAAAGPLDGLLVSPHGAGVSEREPDMDGYWLTRVREAVGPDMPIICVLDPHANVSQRMIDAVNATILYRTNPHIDQTERGLEAASLMARTLRGEIRPTQAAVFPPVAINMECQDPAAHPLLAIYELANDMLKRPGVLSNSVILGFPYADVAEMGSGFVVVTDNNPTLAQQLADELSNYLVTHRHRYTGNLISMKDAVTRARDLQGPVCLLDMGDNIGGGGTADSTLLAHAILEHGQGKPAFVCLFDKEANEKARAAGPGARLTLRMGGRTDDKHGAPLTLDVTVLGIYEGRYEDMAVRHGGQTKYDMKPCSVVRSDNGLTILLTGIRVSPRSIGMLTSVGLNPADFHYIIAKGVHAPTAAYAPVCPHLIRVNTPGNTSADMSLFTFHHRRRPLFPFEEIQ